MANRMLGIRPTKSKLLALASNRVLDSQEEVFISEYCKDYNLTRAYKAAGISSSARAQTYLLDPAIRAELDLITTDVKRQALVTRDDIIAGLRAEATGTYMNSTASSRVAAWTTLARIMGLLDDRAAAANSITVTYTADWRSKTNDQD